MASIFLQRAPIIVPKKNDFMLNTVNVQANIRRIGRKILRREGLTLSATKHQTNRVVTPIASNNRSDGWGFEAYVSDEHSTLKIPTNKQTENMYRHGVILEGNVYREIVIPRSSEVAPDKLANITSLFIWFQETALNHVLASGIMDLNGYGVTHKMSKNKLVWVIGKIHVEVDNLPIWLEALEIDTWCRAAGRNTMRRDWVIKGKDKGVEYVRATSTWVMMGKETRRLCRIPEEVREELLPWYIEEKHTTEENLKKIEKLDSNNCEKHSIFKPTRTDLDMNNHVNNVTLVNWILKNIPHEFLENHLPTGIDLEYRRECVASDVVQSMLGGLNHEQLSYTHLLQAIGSKNQELVRGRTTWREKKHRV